MKNKSKLKKIRESKPAVPAQWLYLSEKELSVRDLQAAFENPEQIEIWEDAGVAEVILDEKASMDLEQTEVDLGDEVSNAFLDSHQAKSLFFVTIPPTAFAQAEICMKKITAVCGGLFCGDTDDFTPSVQ